MPLFRLRELAGMFRRILSKALESSRIFKHIPEAPRADSGEPVKGSHRAMADLRGGMLKVRYCKVLTTEGRNKMKPDLSTSEIAAETEPKQASF